MQLNNLYMQINQLQGKVDTAATPDEAKGYESDLQGLVSQLFMSNQFAEKKDATETGLKTKGQCEPCKGCGKCGKSSTEGQKLAVVS